MATRDAAFLSFVIAACIDWLLREFRNLALHVAELGPLPLRVAVAIVKKSVRSDCGILATRTTRFTPGHGESADRRVVVAVTRL
jgi:hypothetical protein